MSEKKVTWSDVSEKVYEEWTNIRNFEQSEIFFEEDIISSFYRDQAGVILEEVGPDKYRYVNDNGEVRYVVVWNTQEVKIRCQQNKK